MFERQYGRERLVADAAGPLHLLSQPPPVPHVRPPQLDVAAELRRLSIQGRGGGLCALVEPTASAADCRAAEARTMAGTMQLAIVSAEVKGPGLS